MPIRQSRADLGVARGRRIVVDLCRELESARVTCGLSFASLGGAVGITGQQAARVCRGQSPNVSIVRLAAMLIIVGLELSARAFPSGPPVRDAAHLALLDRFRARLAAVIRWIAEAPVIEQPQVLDGSREAILDRRAWDALLLGPGFRVGVEAETRLGDIQALQRRVALKQRDGNVAVVILLVNDTAHNRRAVADDGARLRSGSKARPGRRFGDSRAAWRRTRTRS